MYGLVVQHDSDIILNSFNTGWNNKIYITVYDWHNNKNFHMIVNTVVSRILQELRHDVEFLSLSDFREDLYHE